MEIHLGMNALLGNYCPGTENFSIIPTQIDADKERCVVEFTIIEDSGSKRKVVRQGRHHNNKFKTSVCNIPMFVDIRTGLIRRYRQIIES